MDQSDSKQIYLLWRKVRLTVILLVTVNQYVCHKWLTMLFIKRWHHTHMYMLQFTPHNPTKIFPVFFHKFALSYQLRTEHSVFPFITDSSTYPLCTVLSALFSCHSAPYFISSLTLHFPYPSSQLFVNHTSSALFSWHNAPYFNYSLTLQFPSLSSQLLVTHNLSALFSSHKAP
jgi:hypothetical protein